MAEELPEHVIQEYREAFEVLDENGDGLITTKELRRQMELLFNEDVSEDDLQRMMSEVDLRSHGEIDFDDFLVLMTRPMMDDHSLADVTEAFAEFDTKGNGYVSVDILRDVMSSMGEKLLEEELEEMIEEADALQDGNINYENFAKMLVENFQ